MKSTDEVAANKESVSITLYESDEKSSSNNNEKKSKKEDLNKQDLDNQEMGGRKSATDPTRYGDWERGGRCIDF